LIDCNQPSAESILMTFAEFSSTKTLRAVSRQQLGFSSAAHRGKASAEARGDLQYGAILFHGLGRFFWRAGELFDFMAHRRCT